MPKSVIAIISASLALALGFTLGALIYRVDYRQVQSEIDAAETALNNAQQQIEQLRQEIASLSKPTSIPPTEPPSSITLTPNSTSRYEVLRDSFYNKKDGFTTTIDILVSGEYQDSDIRYLLLNIYDYAKRRARDNPNPNPRSNFHRTFIHAYPSMEYANADYIMSIAQLKKTDDTDDPPEISFDYELLKSFRSLPVVKFGLEQYDRKRICTELILMERESKAAADLLYPIPSVLDPDYSDARFKLQLKRNSQHTEELNDIVKKDLSRQWKITSKQLEEIVLEGIFTKRWPVPPTTGDRFDHRLRPSYRFDELPDKS